MPLRALMPQTGGTSNFDYYVRSVTTAALALIIVGATIYSVLTDPRPSELLVGWTGIVVGVYFGYHVSQNSRGTEKEPPHVEVTTHEGTPHRRESDP